MNWFPSASIATLQQRAEIINTIRAFFISRNILEVETPLLCHTSVTDPYIESIATTLNPTYYLQTSPEYAMKRLLAAGSGAIFQICKAFRQDEAGQHHNPEFTMLEWYRPGFDHHALMNEVDELLQHVLNVQTAERKTYADTFHTYLGIDAHHATIDELAICADKVGISVSNPISDRDTWLQLLMSHYIEPRVGQTRPFFIYDFPVTQAALARIQSSNPPVASRFEVYFKGLELANGFHELQHADEQRKRFEKNLAARKQLNLALLPIDEYFLSALSAGLPDCAGVALGIDRLIMLATKRDRIADVISFDFKRS
jgi:lysyl-tRNA synthetase class 2